MTTSLLKAYIRVRQQVRDRGATAVEYGLLVGLIAAVIVGAVAILGPKLNGYFTTVNNNL